MVDQEVKRDEKGRIIGFTTEATSGTNVSWTVSYLNDDNSSEVAGYTREHAVVFSGNLQGIRRYNFTGEGILRKSELFQVIDGERDNLPVSQTMVSEKRQKNKTKYIETTRSEVGDRFKELEFSKSKFIERYWEEFKLGRERFRELSNKTNEGNESGMETQTISKQEIEGGVTDSGQRAMDLGGEYRGVPEVYSTGGEDVEEKVRPRDPEIQKHFNFEDEDGPGEPKEPSHFPRS